MSFTQTLKEKIVGTTGVLSSFASVLGSYQLCHSLCLSAITLLGLIGITVTGMPLFFLTKVAIPFWIAGFLLLILMLILGRFNILHFSQKLMLANIGLLIAGIPFEQLAQFQKIFWILGAAIVVASIAWALSSKNSSACCISESQHKSKLKNKTKKSSKK